MTAVLKKEKGRKGFIFTLLVLVIIVFMIAELNIYFRAYELRQENQPIKLRSELLGSVASQFSHKQLGKTLFIFLYSSLYELNKDYNNQPSKSGLSTAVWSLAWNGTRDDLPGKPQTTSQNRSLSAWDTKLKNLSYSMGFELSTAYRDIIVSQSDPWSVQINVTVDYNITDPTTSVRIRNTVPMSVNVSIIGFEDPLVARQLGNAKRNIINATALNETTANWVSLTATGELGRGWFYGQPTKITNPSGVSFSQTNKQRILVTNNAQWARQYGNVYGAVVIVEPQQLAQLELFPEIGVPIFVNQSMTLGDPIFSKPFLMVSDNDTAVTGLLSGNYHGLYDIEKAREMASCGLYASNVDTFSFLDRLVSDPGSGVFGIETPLVGIGGWLTSSGVRSAIDHSYLAGAAGTKVMGMPGCHDRMSCNLSYSAQQVGPMRIDPTHAAYYNMTSILCTSNRCG